MRLVRAQGWVSEAARLLRPGGRLVFLTNSVQVTLCVPETGGHAEERLLRPQNGMYRVEWPGGGVEFHPSHGDWIRVLRETGFEVEALHELYAASDTKTPDYYDIATADGRGNGRSKTCGPPGWPSSRDQAALLSAVGRRTVREPHPARVTPHALGPAKVVGTGIPIETRPRWGG